MIEGFVVYGNIPSSTNSRVKAHWGGWIKSKPCRDYEKSFVAQIPEPARIQYAGPVEISLVIFFRRRTSDLAIKFFQDLLQQSGILKNDNQVMRYRRLEKKLDSKNPRIEFSIYALEEEGDERDKGKNGLPQAEKQGSQISGKKT
jgi:Holliday junction resolvase RusA-like endonuclease